MNCVVCREASGHQTVAGFSLVKCGKCRIASLLLPGFKAEDFRSPDVLSAVKGRSPLVCAVHGVRMAVWEVKSASGTLRFDVSQCGAVCVQETSSRTMYSVLNNIKGDVSMRMLPTQLLYHLITIGYSRVPESEPKQQTHDAPYRSLPERCAVCRGPRDANGECSQCRARDAVAGPVGDFSCPRCSSGMTSELRDKNLVRCHSCFGAFMDLRRLELAEIDPMVLLNDKARPLDTKLQCPRCQTSMQGFVIQTPLGELEVDVAACCHGIFFDEGEENVFVRATRIARQESADVTYQETGVFAGEAAIAKQMASRGVFSIMMSRQIDRMEQQLKEERDARERLEAVVDLLDGF